MGPADLRAEGGHFITGRGAGGAASSPPVEGEGRTHHPPTPFLTLPGQNLPITHKLAGGPAAEGVKHSSPHRPDSRFSEGGPRTHSISVP